MPYRTFYVSYCKFNAYKQEAAPMADVFATLTEFINYDATNDYQLKEITTEEVDGTLLGIYKGYVPYTSTVTYPHFTTFNVAEKAEDGKLSVEVATE